MNSPLKRAAATKPSLKSATAMSREKLVEKSLDEFIHPACTRQQNTERETAKALITRALPPSKRKSGWKKKKRRAPFHSIKPRKVSTTRRNRKGMGKREEREQTKSSLHSERRNLYLVMNLSRTSEVCV